MSDYYHDNSADYFESTFHIDPSSFLAPLAARLQEGATVLDIGCGSGRDLLWLHQKGFRPTGLERAANLAELAGKNSGCDIIEADYHSFDFSNLHFDALLLIGSLVHLERHQFPRVLQSIGKALKNRGYLYLTMKEGEGKKSNKDGRVFTLWQQSELEKIFARQYLTVLDFSRQISKIRQSDVWLGYLLQKNEIQ